MIAKLFTEHFHRAPTARAKAPGRLEFIGNHVDYNGGPVMGVAVNRHVTVAIAPREDNTVRLWSDTLKHEVTVSLDALEPLSGEDGWANYALGALDELRKVGMATPHGFDMAVDSDLPAGAGMSSSAAFELASAYAMCELYGFSLERADMARLARRTENNFVGVPCGILDQGVSAFGEENAIVKIDCEKEIFTRLPLPGGVHFWVFNTAKKHALLDSLYATRHKECHEALALLRQALPDVPCLAAVTREQLNEHRDLLAGAHYRRARHVVTECERVRDMETALSAGDMAAAGKLLYASHASSRDDFENSVPELDFIVERLREENAVWGARLTGGGFGGAVMAVTSGEFDQAAAEAVAGAYLERFGQPAGVFHTTTGAGAAPEPVQAV